MKRYICAECSAPLGKMHDSACGKCAIGCPEVVKDDCTIVWTSPDDSVPAESAAYELHEFIDDCEGDTLAALYECAFGRVESATFNDESNTIDFTAIDG